MESTLNSTEQASGQAAAMLLLGRLIDA